MVSGLVLLVLLVSSFFSSFGVLVVGINDGVKVAALTFNCVVAMLLLLWSGTTFFVVVVSSCASAVADEEVRRMILGAAVDIAAAVDVAFSNERL